MSDQSQSIKEFKGRIVPEPIKPVGYAALIHRYNLQLPLPPRLAGIADRHKPPSTNEWHLFSPRHAPQDSLFGHLEFALKWEGIDLGVLAALFKDFDEREIAAIVRAEPTGAYARRIWYLYEWLTDRQLDVPSPGKVRAVPVVNPEKQFAIQEGTPSSRHKILDNLPGTRAFCPMVRKTAQLDSFIEQRFHERAGDIVGRTHADVIRRAAAFLLLSDSKASFQIEGEHPSLRRMERWGTIIGRAGTCALSINEFERLQKLVIGDARFVHLGLRTEGGFIGLHDRSTREPIPDHISARHEDLKSLLEGIIAYDERSTRGNLDAVIAAASSAFGFVYIHPFEDGNGRLHRWLIHHVLARAGYTPPHLVFPVSAVMHRDMGTYRAVLESYSRPLLAFIDWEPTATGNVHVNNDTVNFYRYFDATAQAEFLYGCVEQTVNQDLPDEIAYLQAYDRFSQGVQDILNMPNRTIDLLHRFLTQGEGHLSERAKSKEFASLTHDEIMQVEDLYSKTFTGLIHHA